MKCGTFHMKSIALFMKSTAFHEKWHFSWKVLCFSYEKHLKSLKTADSTHICLLDLVVDLTGRLFTDLIGLSYERPILGNNLKAQSEMQCFSWNVALFIWKAVLFMKSIALFIWKAPEIIKNSWFNTHLPFGSGLSQRTEVRPTSLKCH